MTISGLMVSQMMGHLFVVVPMFKMRDAPLGMRYNHLADRFCISRHILPRLIGEVFRRRGQHCTAMCAL